MSGDRVALGIGAGWMREEFELARATLLPPRQADGRDARGSRARSGGRDAGAPRRVLRLRSAGDEARARRCPCRSTLAGTPRSPSPVPPATTAGSGCTTSPRSSWSTVARSIRPARTLALRIARSRSSPRRWRAPSRDLLDEARGRRSDTILTSAWKSARVEQPEPDQAEDLLATTPIDSSAEARSPNLGNVRGDAVGSARVRQGSANLGEVDRGRSDRPEFVGRAGRLHRRRDGRHYRRVDERRHPRADGGGASAAIAALPEGGGGPGALGVCTAAPDVAGASPGSPVRSSNCSDHTGARTLFATSQARSRCRARRSR